MFQLVHSEPLAYCALIIRTFYYTCGTVGQSITSTSNLCEHSYLSVLHLSKHDTGSLPYYILYMPIIYIAHIYGVQWRQTPSSVPYITS